MITIIRNDKDARFAHDVYGIKIKEELPMYKIIGTTRNEGLCIYESSNYAAVTRIFDIIIEAISNGEKNILIIPPIVDHKLTKEEFINSSDIYDYRKIDDDNPIRFNEDIYGRKIENFNSINDDNTMYYSWDCDKNNFSSFN